MNPTRVRELCKGLSIRGELYSDTLKGCIMELRNEISYLESLWMQTQKGTKESKENEALVETLEKIVYMAKKG